MFGASESEKQMSRHKFLRFPYPASYLQQKLRYKGLGLSESLSE
jgi:hypothetical protein